MICERCGGTGWQQFGCYSLVTKRYDEPAGVCTTCGGSGNLGGKQSWPERMNFTTESHDALNRLLDTREEHPADAHETYFQASGENYRIRIERIPETCEQKPVK